MSELSLEHTSGRSHGKDMSSSRSLGNGYVACRGCTDDRIKNHDVTMNAFDLINDFKLCIPSVLGYPDATIRTRGGS